MINDEYNVHRAKYWQGYELESINKYFGQHKQRHSLKAFYNRMKGFGAAGMIMAFLNIKKLIKQKPLLKYFALFLFLIIYSVSLILALFINLRITSLLIIFFLSLLLLYSLISAGFRIIKTKSNVIYLPIALFYTLVKLIAIILGVFWGLVYYARKK